MIRWTWMLAVLTGCASVESADRPTLREMGWYFVDHGKPRTLELLSRPDVMGPPFGREFGEGLHAVDVVNQSREVRYLPPLPGDTFPASESMANPHEGKLRLNPGESVRVWCTLPAVSPDIRVLVRTLIRRPHPGSWEGMGLDRYLMPTVLEVYGHGGKRIYAPRQILGIEVSGDLWLFMEMSSDDDNGRS